MPLSDISLVLIFGFVSSLHCVGMCGPIVLTYSVAANTDGSRRPLFGLHLAYNLGRTLTYSMLGAVAGAAGGAMGWVFSLAGFENTVSVVAGAAMILAALVMLGASFGFKGWGGFRVPDGMLKAAGRLIASPSIAAKFLLGAVMGFLPCGLIYAALMKAIGTGTPLAGAETMLAFGLGTSLALIAIGLGSSAATRKLARWGTTISAITVLLMGAILIARGTLAGPVHCHMYNMAL